MFTASNQMQGCASWSANTWAVSTVLCPHSSSRWQWAVPNLPGDEGSRQEVGLQASRGLSDVTGRCNEPCCCWALPLLLTRRDMYAWYTARRSPARVGLTSCTVNAIVLHKQRSRKSTRPAMCVWRLSLAHTIWPNTNKKQDTRRNRQYGRVCLLTLRYSHIQMMDSILICRLISDKSICTRHNVPVFCLDCMMRCACMQHVIPYSVILW